MTEAEAFDELVAVADRGLRENTAAAVEDILAHLRDHPEAARVLRVDGRKKPWSGPEPGYVCYDKGKHAVECEDCGTLNCCEHCMWEPAE